MQTQQDCFLRLLETDISPEQHQALWLWLQHVLKALQLFC